MQPRPPRQRQLFTSQLYHAARQPAPPPPRKLPPTPQPLPPAPISADYPPRCCHEQMRLMEGDIGPRDFYFQCDVCGRYQEID